MFEPPEWGWPASLFHWGCLFHSARASNNRTTNSSRGGLPRFQRVNTCTAQPHQIPAVLRRSSSLAVGARIQRQMVALSRAGIGQARRLTGLTYFRTISAHRAHVESNCSTAKVSSAEARWIANSLASSALLKRPNPSQFWTTTECGSECLGCSRS